MENSKSELCFFPYVDYDRSDSPKEKHQKPYLPKGFDVKNIYRKSGHALMKTSEVQEGYRFNVEKREFLCTKDFELHLYDNMVTLSRPSAEVVCTRINKDTGKLEICLILQPRTPYTVVVGGDEYARFFLEDPAGLVEKGETIKEAAVRETKEETGYEVAWIQPLISPYVCRHVSYSSETSGFYVVGVGKQVKQQLDEDEDIRPYWYPAEEVEKELENYLEGRKENFYDFDLPETTILGLQRFFVKWHRGDFEGIL